MNAEALFCCGYLREIPATLLSPERILDTLEATQEVPQHPICTGEEPRCNSRRT